MSLPKSEGVSASGSFDPRADEQVERLVGDIAGIIRRADPEDRAELKDLAEALLHDEISAIAEEPTAAQRQAASLGFNPLLPGILIALLGMGFLLIFPMVGMTLTFIGAVLVISGGVISWLKP